VHTFSIGRFRTLVIILGKGVHGTPYVRCPSWFDIEASPPYHIASFDNAMEC
jgi:hypothetical protein